MNQLINVINQYTELELNLFFDEIIQKKPELFKMLCSILKTDPKEDLLNIYNRPSIKDDMDWFEKQITTADEIPLCNYCFSFCHMNSLNKKNVVVFYSSAEIYKG